MPRIYIPYAGAGSPDSILLTSIDSWQETPTNVDYYVTNAEDFLWYYDLIEPLDGVYYLELKNASNVTIDYGFVLFQKSKNKVFASKDFFSLDNYYNSSSSYVIDELSSHHEFYSFIYPNITSNAITVNETSSFNCKNIGSSTTLIKLNTGNFSINFKTCIVSTNYFLNLATSSNDDVRCSITGDILRCPILIFGQPSGDGKAYCDIGVKNIYTSDYSSFVLNSKVNIFINNSVINAESFNIKSGSHIFNNCTIITGSIDISNSAVVKFINCNIIGDLDISSSTVSISGNTTVSGTITGSYTIDRYKTDITESASIAAINVYK